MTDTPEVKRYQHLKLLAGLCSLTLSLSFLAVMALLFGPSISQLIQDRVTANIWLRLIALGSLYAAGLEVFTLPVDFWSGFLLEHRYQLSNQNLVGWIWKRVKGWVLAGALGLPLLLGLYALLWNSGPWWWLWAAAGWLIVTLVLGQLLPVVILPLFYKVTPIADDALLDRLQRLARDTGLNVQGIYKLHLSAETRKANAALAGLGRTRRVLLGDTLLDKFTSEEIEVVFAHEVGHHVHRHLLQMVVVSVALAAAGFWVADWVLRHTAESVGYRGTGQVPAFADPGALPFLLLILGLFGLLLSPLQNALSRFFERQCDRYALARTGNPEAYRSTFLKLAEMNKADIEPHPLVVWLFEDHPSIGQRLELVKHLESPKESDGKTVPSHGGGLAGS